MGHGDNGTFPGLDQNVTRDPEALLLPTNVWTVPVNGYISPVLIVFMHWYQYVTCTNMLPVLVLCLSTDTSHLCWFCSCISTNMSPVLVLCLSTDTSHLYWFCSCTGQYLTCIGHLHTLDNIRTNILPVFLPVSICYLY